MHLAASISMRTAAAVHFGTATHIALTLLVVESPGTIDQGLELEFQLELPGMKDTVYGRAVVHHAQHYDDQPSAYELRIMNLRAGDEVLLREWVDDMHHGGSSVHPHRHLREADLSSVISEVRTADTTGLPSGAVSTWDARRTAKAGPSARGRSSLRDGLRRHLERVTEPELELELSTEPLQPEDGEAIDIELEITEP